MIGMDGVEAVAGGSVVAILVCVIVLVWWLTANPKSFGGKIVVKTTKGAVRGHRTQDALRFTGIPFARPPLGELRFEKPVPPPAWHETLDCTAPPKSAMQPTRDREAVSEDCLYLNIIAPPNAASRRLPVYVWIYGGAFLTGSPGKALYNGVALAKEGIIQVNLTYRLGAFGWLTYQKGEELVTNAGFYDLLLGLQWVKDNIQAFGGDPNNITIGGESAGAVLVSDLILSPKAKGLFHKAIAESGSPLSHKSQVERRAGDVDWALEQSERFMAACGAKTIEQLKQVDAKTLVRQYRFPFDFTANAPIAMFPTNDGVALPKDPFGEMAKGNYHKVALLAGFNTDDGAEFVPAAALTQEAYEGYIKRTLGDRAACYLERFPVDQAHSLEQRAGEYATMSFRFGAQYLNECNAKRGIAGYQYRFGYNAATPTQAEKKAWHGLEMPFVFNNLQAEGLGAAQDKAVVANIFPYWVNFIKNGDPNKGLAVPLPWPKYEENKLMEFHTKNALIDNPNQDLYDFFKEVFVT